MKEYIVKTYFKTKGNEVVAPDIVRELIRCKDCKHVGTDATLCLVCNREGMGLRPAHVYRDDYCSYAEPKETE